MFKRKEAVPPGVGRICVIKNEVANHLNETEYYKNKSISRFASDNGYYIKSKMFGKEYGYRELLFADCKLVYVLEDSHFKGLVNVIPLAIHNDSMRGAAIRRYMDVNRKKLFTTSLDSLSLSNAANTESVLGSAYVYDVKTDIILYLNEIRKQSTHI